MQDAAPLVHRAHQECALVAQDKDMGWTAPRRRRGGPRRPTVLCAQPQRPLRIQFRPLHGWCAPGIRRRRWPWGVALNPQPADLCPQSPAAGSSPGTANWPFRTSQRVRAAFARNPAAGRMGSGPGGAGRHPPALRVPRGQRARSLARPGTPDGQICQAPEAGLHLWASDVLAQERLSRRKLDAGLATGAPSMRASIIKALGAQAPSPTKPSDSHGESNP